MIINIPDARFDGPNYDPELDHSRLRNQLRIIVNVMQDGTWRTLNEIANITGQPPASISAQLRHLRKPKFGSHTVLKQSRNDRRYGLWEYKLILNKAGE